MFRACLVLKQLQNFGFQDMNLFPRKNHSKTLIKSFIVLWLTLRKGGMRRGGMSLCTSSPISPSLSLPTTWLVCPFSINSVLARIPQLYQYHLCFIRKWYGYVLNFKILSVSRCIFSLFFLSRLVKLNFFYNHSEIICIMIFWYFQCNLQYFMNNYNNSDFKRS